MNITDILPFWSSCYTLYGPILCNKISPPLPPPSFHDVILGHLQLLRLHNARVLLKFRTVLLQGFVVVKRINLLTTDQFQIVLTSLYYAWFLGFVHHLSCEQSTLRKLNCFLILKGKTRSTGFVVPKIWKQKLFFIQYKCADKSKVSHIRKEVTSFGKDVFCLKYWITEKSRRLVGFWEKWEKAWLFANIFSKLQLSLVLSELQNHLPRMLGNLLENKIMRPM